MGKYPAPFALPKRPVDGHRVEWWQVQAQFDEVKVVAHAALYFANATFKTVAQKYMDDFYAKAKDIDSLPPFVDQWLTFSDGRSDGRIPGWAELVSLEHSAPDRWKRCYTTEAEAQRAACVEAQRLIESIEQRAGSLVLAKDRLKRQIRAWSR